MILRGRSLNLRAGLKLKAENPAVGAGTPGSTSLLLTCTGSAFHRATSQSTCPAPPDVTASGRGQRQGGAAPGSTEGAGRAAASQGALGLWGAGICKTPAGQAVAAEAGGRDAWAAHRPGAGAPGAERAATAHRLRAGAGRGQLGDPLPRLWPRGAGPRLQRPEGDEEWASGRGQGGESERAGASFPACARPPAARPSVPRRAGRALQSPPGRLKPARPSCPSEARAAALATGASHRSRVLAPGRSRLWPYVGGTSGTGTGRAAAVSVEGCFVTGFPCASLIILQPHLRFYFNFSNIDRI